MLPKALSDVDLEVSKGVIFGLLASKRSGKDNSDSNSLIKSLISDRDSVYSMRNYCTLKHIAQIGYLPEERGLYKKNVSLDQMIYFARLKGLYPWLIAKKQDQNHWLTSWKISNCETKNRLKTFSKGNGSKKSNLSLTVIITPLLILDEPFQDLIQ